MIYTKEQRSNIFSCSSDSLKYSDLLRCPLEICNETFSYDDPVAHHNYFKMRFLIAINNQSTKWSTSSRHMGNKTFKRRSTFSMNDSLFCAVLKYIFKIIYFPLFSRFGVAIPKDCGDHSREASSSIFYLLV